MMRATAASAELVERHRPEILRYLGRMLHDTGDAEDACQDVFLRAHRAAGRLRADSNVRAWLYRIATNRALNARRSRARAMARTADVDVDALTASTGSAEERADVHAVRRAVDRIVGDAPAKRPADETRRAGGRPVYYCAVPSPIGRLFIAASEAGLVRVSFQQPERAFLEELRRAGIEPVRSRTRTADVVHQLRAYFAGERRSFDIRVDLSGVSSFQRDVLMAAANIPAGQVVSYGEI